MSKQDFEQNKKNFQSIENAFEQAAAFFAINRASFNGGMKWYSQANAMRNPNRVLEKLTNFDTCKNIKIIVQDFSSFLDRIPKETGVLLYVDPPYVTDKKHYGWDGEMHKGFDHFELAKILLAIDKSVPWLLCYNDCPLVRQLYNKCKIYTVSWYHSMGLSTFKGRKPVQNQFEVIVVSNKLNAALP